MIAGVVHPVFRYFPGNARLAFIQLVSLQGLPVSHKDISFHNIISHVNVILLEVYPAIRVQASVHARRESEAYRVISVKLDSLTSHLKVVWLVTVDWVVQT